jgi:hypothetical protein
MSISTEEVLVISQDMLLAAEAGEWDRLVTLENTRSAKLASIFSDQTDSEYSAQRLVAMIHSVLELDRKITSLCSDESASCKQQISDFKKGRKAIASYQRFSA